MPDVRLRADAYRAAAREAGHITLAQRANAAGLTQPTIYRLISGASAPGNRAIAGLMTAYGLAFEDLFEVTDESREFAA